MSLMSSWIYASSESVPSFAQSSVANAIWDMARMANPSGCIYLGAAPTLLHMITPSIWPVCYFPEWCIRNRSMLLDNAPDKLSWVLTKWALDFLLMRPIEEAPIGQKCAIVYSGSYHADSTYGMVIDVWPEWPTVRRVPPMAIFRPIYNVNLGLPSGDMLHDFEEAMAGFVEARNSSGIADAVASLNANNPFLHLDEDEDEEYDEDEDEEYDEEYQEPDHE